VEETQPFLKQDDFVIAYEQDAAYLEDVHTFDFSPSIDEPVNSWRYAYVKRAFDYMCAAILLVLFAIPGLLIAAAIKLTSQGPVFYREERIGRGGRPFKIWKFRSMCMHPELSGRIKISQSESRTVHRRMCKHLPDPRITAIGRIMRKWSLDELPQLLNVLRGEMSLIGPRPIVEAETVFYKDLFDLYLQAYPGLSGLWQVSGRSNVGYESRAKLDAMYVQFWSLRGDLHILLLTIPAVLNRVGAH
jgi:lipopolysaccharide/colanic/teichoic acid biosynthesis glycosyltransferase